MSRNQRRVQFILDRWWIDYLPEDIRKCASAQLLVVFINYVGLIGKSRRTRSSGKFESSPVTTTNYRFQGLPHAPQYVAYLGFSFIFVSVFFTILRYIKWCLCFRIRNMYIDLCIMNYGLDLALIKIKGLFFLMNGNFMLSFKYNDQSLREINWEVIHYHDQYQHIKNK